jgi:pre-mRNA-processing factor 6
LHYFEETKYKPIGFPLPFPFFSILENEEEAKVLLKNAFTCIPSSTEMWLALAKLESYQEARKVLNAASNANPHSVQIYIAAAKLEEA